MPDLEQSIEGSTLVMRMNRPEKLNAMSPEMLAGLDDGIRRAATDRAIRAVVLTGAGRGFCAGADMSRLGERAGTKAGRSYEQVQDFRPEHPAPWSLCTLTKPVIGAINGVAVGIGIELATMCDLRIAGESARFGWVFVQRGLVPDLGVGTWLLPRIVGHQHAAHLLMSGEIIGAHRGKDVGYVLDVVPDSALMERALELAASVSTGAPLAIGAAKRLLYRAEGREPVPHLLDHGAEISALFGSEDFKEGVRAFQEKRAPQWRGE